MAISNITVTKQATDWRIEWVQDGKHLATTKDLFENVSRFIEDELLQEATQ